MFTGIITHQAKLQKIKLDDNQDALIELIILNPIINRNLEIGCSISCNGICLTLIKKKNTQENWLLSFKASKETCTKTTLKNWQDGDIINIEFAMKIGDELGGHMVLGHIDAVTSIINFAKIQDSWQFKFALPSALKKFIAPKGSITINGTSLTINEVKDNSFFINIIEHTWLNTNFQFCKINDLVNLEIDVIARYLEQITKKYEQ